MELELKPHRWSIRPNNFPRDTSGELEMDGICFVVRRLWKCRPGGWERDWSQSQMVGDSHYSQFGRPWLTNDRPRRDFVQGNRVLELHLVNKSPKDRLTTIWECQQPQIIHLTSSYCISPQLTVSTATGELPVRSIVWVSKDKHFKSSTNHFLLCDPRGTCSRASSQFKTSSFVSSLASAVDL